MSNELEPNEKITQIYTTINTINDSLTLFKMQISTVQLQVRNLEKDIKKELKNNKKIKKNIPKSASKKPSGFAKPTKVTKELCAFLEKPEGTEFARTEVTKTLINYIKTNNLQNSNNKDGTKIVPDTKLKMLLNIDDEEISKLTFFNIQKHMNKHFFSKKNDLINNNNVI
jgi:chromatin remodeling complex protein RSC6